MVDIPPGYRRLEGSKIHHLPSTKFIKPADRNETIQILFVLCRRSDGQAPPNGPEFFLHTPITQRQRLPTTEFAARYGASPTDISHVTTFANTAHLKITEVNAARRTIRAVGTVASMEKAFAVKIGYYRRDVVDREGKVTQTETYRGQDGFIHLPIRLTDIIITVSGLDNRCVTKRNDNDSDGDPPDTVHTTVPEIAQLYNFPTLFPKKGQTIAILSRGGGYLDSDITSYFNDLKLLAPKITDVCIDGATKSTTHLTETTMDICTAGSAAQGVSIAVYFITGDLQSWLDAVGRITFPDDGDPACTVLSCSHYISAADDSKTLEDKHGIKDSWMQSMTMAFEDAAMMGVTVIFASGDHGSAPKASCKKARVQYPPSDPWVLTVGGTTVGDLNVNSGAFDEFVWNDSDGGATGGGVSDYFPLPWYQQGVEVPRSINDQHSGRGIPDVAANASKHSCYKFYINGLEKYEGGTSVAAPLWAGLIALINASLGEEVGCPDLGSGFLNPILYSMYLNPDRWMASGWKPFRNISGPPGPTDNVYQGADDVPGYPSVEGRWDACTGLGSIDGLGLLNCLAADYLQ